MKIINISHSHFFSLYKERIPLDCIYTLQTIKEGGDIENEAFMPHIQKLQRKGYLDINNKITEYGEEVLSFICKKVENIEILPKKKSEKGKFDEWWEIFPDSNYFSHGGIDFKGTQNKKLHKEQCRKIFNILSSSLFSADDIIKATKYHINVAMELSVKKRENQLTFIPNSERYLREQYFKPYIERMNKEIKNNTKTYEI